MFWYQHGKWVQFECVNNSQSACCAASPAEWSQFLWGIDSPHSLVPISPVSRREERETSCYSVSFMKSAPLSNTLMLSDQISRQHSRQMSNTAFILIHKLQMRKTCKHSNLPDHKQGDLETLFISYKVLEISFIPSQ